MMTIKVIVHASSLSELTELSIKTSDVYESIDLLPKQSSYGYFDIVLKHIELVI